MPSSIQPSIKLKEINVLYHSVSLKYSYMVHV